MSLIDKFDQDVRFWERAARKIKQQNLYPYDNLFNFNYFIYYPACSSINDWISTFISSLPTLNNSQYNLAKSESCRYVPKLMDYLLEELVLYRGRDILEEIKRKEQFKQDGDILNFIDSYEAEFIRLPRMVTQEEYTEILEEIKKIQLPYFENL